MYHKFKRTILADYIVIAVQTKMQEITNQLVDATIPLDPEITMGIDISLLWGKCTIINGTIFAKPGSPINPRV